VRLLLNLTGTAAFSSGDSQLAAMSDIVVQQALFGFIWPYEGCSRVMHVDMGEQEQVSRYHGPAAMA
jgi:hypothetical protein